MEHPATTARYEPAEFTPPPVPPTPDEIELLVDAELARAREAGLAAARGEIDAVIAEHRTAMVRLEEATAAMGAAAAQLHAHDRAVLDDFSDKVFELAIELAVAVVGRELSSMDAPVVEAAKRAAGLVPERSDIVVRVNPADADLVAEADGTASDDLAAVFGARHSITVVADASIEAGACIVHVGALRIDTQVGPALERMRSALRD